MSFPEKKFEAKLKEFGLPKERAANANFWARWGYAQAEKDIMNKPSWEFYAGKQTAKEEFKARDAQLRELLETAKAFADDSECLGKICDALLLVEEGSLK